MPERHRIEALPSLVGQTVSVRGWVMTTRSSGKIAFVVLRDGTGSLQAVLSKKEVPDAAWAAFGQLTQETSIEVTGSVRADARAPGGGGVELQASDLAILGPSRDFPITPKETAPPSCSSTATSGCDRAGRWRSRGCDTRWSRRFATSSTSVASCSWIPRSS